MNTNLSTREELVAQIMWSQGYGHGICAVANMMMSALATPSAGNPDWPSVVAVTLPESKYTDEELALLVEFSKERTARYDRMFSQRMGANLTVIDKQEKSRWLRKRQSWNVGSMYSSSLEEALEVFRAGLL